MITKILGLVALLASLSSVSVSAFASEEDALAPDSTQSNTVMSEIAPPPRCEAWMRNCNPNPPRCEPWMRNCRPQPNPNFVCYARNVTGRTFAAYGNYRTPRYYIQQRALDMCRNQSFPLIRRTCQSIGCRSEGGYDNGGHGGH